MKTQHAPWAMVAALLLCPMLGYAKEVIYVPAQAGTISVVDVATNTVGIILQTNRADFRGLRAFSMTADPTHAWVVDGSGTLAWIDLQTTELSNRIETLSVVTQLLLSPDGALAYIRTDRPNMLVVDLRAQRVVQTLSLKPTSPLALSSDGTRLYVASTDIAGDPLLSVVDTATYRVVNSVPWPAGAPFVSPNADSGFAFQQRSVGVVDVQELSISNAIPVQGSPRDLVFSPDGLLAYIATAEPATLSILDTNPPALTAQISIPDNRLRYDFSAWRLALTASGKRAAVLQSDACDVAVVDTEARQTVATVPVEASAFDLGAGTAPDELPAQTPLATVSPSPGASSPNVCVYVTIPSTQSISVIDPAAQRVTGAIPISSRGLLAINAAGTQLYATTTTNFGFSGAIAVIDTSTNTLGDVIFTGDEAFFLARGAAESVIYAQLRSECYDLAVVDPTHGQLVNRVNIGGAGEIGVLPDGSRLYVPQSHAQRVAVLDAATQGLITAIPFPDEYVLHVAVTPDSRLVYVSADGISHPEQHRYVALDTATNTVVASIPMPEQSYDAVVTPDGQFLYVLLASASGAGTLAVVDTPAQAMTATVALGMYPGRIAVNPDGSQIYVTFGASGSQASNAIEILDAASYAVRALIALPGVPGGLAVGAVPGDCSAPATPTSTASQTATPSRTGTVQPTTTPTPTPTGTASPSATATPTLTPTNTPSHTPTAVPTATATAEPTTTATLTATATQPHPPSPTQAVTTPSIASDGGCNLGAATHSTGNALWLAALLGFAAIRRREQLVRKDFRFRTGRLLPAAILIAASCVTSAAMSSAEAPSERPANVVHLDASGRPVVPTAPAAVPAGSSAAVSATPPSLEMRDAPGGGKMIILDDRFRNNSTAHRTAQGATIECGPPDAVLPGRGDR